MDLCLFLTCNYLPDCVWPEHLWVKTSLLKLHLHLLCVQCTQIRDFPSLYSDIIIQRLWYIYRHLGQFHPISSIIHMSVHILFISLFNVLFHLVMRNIIISVCIMFMYLFIKFLLKTVLVPSAFYITVPDLDLKWLPVSHVVAKHHQSRFKLDSHPLLWMCLNSTTRHQSSWPQYELTVGYRVNIFSFCSFSVDREPRKSSASTECSKSELCFLKPSSI